jgi:Phosphoesterase family
VANVKGVGSRGEPANPPVATKGRHVKNFLGTVTRFAPPTAGELEGHTRQVRDDARVPEALRALERADRAAQGGPAPPPVPARSGEPSVFDHIVYVIKENRTYDQVFGDIKSGNGDPRLCIFGREVTPNHHTLAEQFVLLDNFYCNGVVSADGHAWATEGFVTDYFEKAFGGFTRVYFAGDALSFSPTGFIWDNVLLHGLSFRNYGEKDFPTTVPPAATFKDIYSDFTKGGGKVRIVNKFSLDPLKPYSAPGYAGWNVKIPDVVRADVFLKELAKYDSAGGWPNFVTVYLPNDHTSGTSPNYATPRAMVADNDLALGRVVEAVSHSKYWPTTCIFVIEDDPQAGFDHVDGHRSLCLVISPYTKRGQTVSTFYNQTAVLHTMEQMLGLPPMNQMDAMAPLMSDCFRPDAKPDLTPYTVRPNQVPLDEMNKRVADLGGEERKWAEASLAQYLAEPDRADDDTLNRVLWHAARGGAPYPAELAGAHGKGLKAAGLKLDRRGGAAAGRDDDDE